MRIGITGGSGCGKTTALGVLKNMGFRCIDADEVYHRLLISDAEMVSAILEEFPEAAEYGTVNRKKLGCAVFGSPDRLRLLNSITHPCVKRAIEKELDAADSVIDAFGLIEGDLASLCDVTVAVLAPERDRVRRLMSRESISEEYALARIQSQKPDSFFKTNCDRVLYNDGSLETFVSDCEDLFQKLINEKNDKGDSKMKENLMFSPKNGFDRMSCEEKAEMNAYCRRYLNFMDAAKTEREAVTETIRVAKENGFVEYRSGMELKPGDKVYANNRGKSIIFAVIGEKKLDEGCHITAAHSDSPRLDVKPNPLSEDSELCLLKTHYYGGIKKYQWTTVPLALHGVVTLKDGTVITVKIGEDENDPIFCVTDLLIHLAADQMQKTLAQGVTGENLRVLMGSEPIEGEESDRVKKNVMSLLNEKYGFTEEDFLSAELTMVPAGKSRELGLDRSMLAAYGHDDRVCAYAEFEPLLTLGTPTYTAVCILADKEEIGSVGVSGMQSDYFSFFMEDLCDMQGVKLRHCYANAACISADVSNAYDPIYAEVSDKQNNSRLNYGVAFCKYTGARGKSGCSDASSEFFAYVRRICDDAQVVWQTAELGKVDQGGGGTVAAFMANRNISTLDAGVPVLSMHAPMEVVSKVDTWMTRKAMDAFYRAK